jgi:hypothetical protein
MSSEVVERIHKALASHPLERIENGYRRVHPEGGGRSILRLLPVNVAVDGAHVDTIAEVVAEYDSVNLPSFHATGVQRLNARAVYGAYHLSNGQLRQTAQYSIYSNESAAHAAAQSILNAFGSQLPLGRSMALGITSAAMLKEQRAFHGLAPQWQTSLGEESFKTAANLLQQNGWAAANSATSVWAEVPLSGNCPSRSIDPQAETALLQVNEGIPHPIAGAGYLATISLPTAEAPPNAAEICARLNALEMQQVDFVPRLGAWGLLGPKDLPVYSCFIPCTQPLGDMHITLMWWCVSRTVWLREKFWAAKQGLQLQAMAPRAESQA